MKSSPFISSKLNFYAVIALNQKTAKLLFKKLWKITPQEKTTYKKREYIENWNMTYPSIRNHNRITKQRHNLNACPKDKTGKLYRINKKTKKS